MSLVLTLGAFLLVSPLTLTPFAVVEHAPLNELSGLAQSRRSPGVYWAHNDSGDTPRLFAIREDGRTVWPEHLRETYFVGREGGGKLSYPGLRIAPARNVDWEEIVLDDDTLYVMDVGNNGNARRDLGVYALREPNPLQDTAAQPFAFYPVRYPDQTAFPPSAMQFDCEAAFAFRGKLYFLTKHRILGVIPDTGTNLYRMDTRHTDQDNVLVKIEGRTGLGGWVTAADLSPDGKTLAVLCHLPVASVWLFETPSEGDRFLSSPARRRILLGLGQCEALAWIDAKTLLIGNEAGQLFKLAASDCPPAP